MCLPKHGMPIFSSDPPTLSCLRNPILEPSNSLGALSVDETFTLLQAVAGGNSNTMGFVLLPQTHSSCSRTAILAHRRLVEDKAVATLDLMVQTYSKSVVRAGGRWWAQLGFRSVI